MAQEATPTWLDLYDYRRHVSAMYRERERALISGADERAAVSEFRATKDSLFASHPQSPLNVEQRAAFSGLRYFDYDPLLRVEALLAPEEPTDDVILAMDGEHELPMRRMARLDFALGGIPQHLAVYWIDVYGGGLFLPFRDATCPQESYGGGRYLFDTVKGSDFSSLDAEGQVQKREVGAPYGYRGGWVILDFNYAYNPSCAYDSRWVCPLAPPENRLAVPIRAGEKKYG